MAKTQEFKFQDLTPEEKERRGILGRLYGPCASISIPTRNGRFYSESLWNKVFENREDNITMEMFKNGGIPMELDHPADRLETCSDRIAAMMPEPPVKNDKNQMVCYIDIIDTPCGKIAYQLAKYGFNLGISSRGNGEVETDFDGNESVNPDTYDFQTFDLVLLPAVKEARLKLMTESLEGKTFKQALNESLSNASPEDKKIMEETLQNLNIDYSDSQQEIVEESDNNKETMTANDNGVELIKNLQEAILAKEQAEAKITELQEKLSVCYAKETSMEEDLNKYKGVIRNLSESNSKLRKLEDEIKSLNEQLIQKDNLINEEKSKVVKATKIQSLNESKQTSLKESLSEKTKQLENANQQVAMLTEKLESNNKKFEEEKQQLTESYEDLKKDYTIKQSEYTRKLSQSNKLVEQYRDTAKKAVDRYIESKALILGVNKNEIKNQLPRNYSFNDIDLICEKLGDYKLQLDSLPFDIKSVKSATITESHKLFETKNPYNDGDDVDEQLINIAKNLINN